MVRVYQILVYILKYFEIQTSFFSSLTFLILNWKTQYISEMKQRNMQIDILTLPGKENMSSAIGEYA